MNNQYIWHCSGENCRSRGTILFKTSEPFIKGGVVQCSVCKHDLRT